MGKKILGIDEAGRGSVISDLVVAGAMIDEDRMEDLKKLKVKDSKLLTRKQRDDLEEKIKAVLDDFVVLKIPANKIDELRKTINLNKMEVDKMAEITNLLKPDVVIVDAPQVSTEKFKGYVHAKLDNKKCEVIAENKADVKYPIVSAASILAKVVRDREMDKVSEKVGKDLGVGYPHDAKTIKHLEELIKAGKPLPDYVRQSWDTVVQMKKKKQQKNFKNL